MQTKYNFIFFFLGRTLLGNEWILAWYQTKMADTVKLSICDQNELANSISAQRIT